MPKKEDYTFIRKNPEYFFKFFVNNSVIGNIKKLSEWKKAKKELSDFLENGGVLGVDVGKCECIKKVNGKYIAIEQNTALSQTKLIKNKDKVKYEVSDNWDYLPKDKIRARQEFKDLNEVLLYLRVNLGIGIETRVIDLLYKKTVERKDGVPSFW